MQQAATSFPDHAFRTLLWLRINQPENSYCVDLGDLVHSLVVQPGGTLDAIEAELGFSMHVDFVDEARDGESDFTPSWEWIECHDDWFELAYVLSADGFGWIVFIQDNDGVYPKLHSLCRTYTK